MIGLVKLHHVSFASKDLKASRAFFSGVLGLEEIERPAFSFPGAWYRLGDRQLHIIAREEEAAAGAPRSSRSDHLALEVADLEAVRSRLRSHGIPFQEGGNRHLGMEQIYCRDPDGHVIEFVRYH
jgi:glyoxylase I family protein